MIFVSVGTQLPFDRLIRAVDAWALKQPEEDIFAQIGDTAYVPEHIKFAGHLPPEDFRNACARAELIVSHAGIGNLLLALEMQKPLVVMPRRAELKEHRNDHQMATVKLLREKFSFVVATEASEIDQAIRQARALTSTKPLSAFASSELIAALKEFINR